jgi:hypothetical protein
MLHCRTETPWNSIAPPVALRRSEVVAEEPVRVLLVEDNQEAADLVRVYLSEQREDRFLIEWIPLRDRC